MTSVSWLFDVGCIPQACTADGTVYDITNIVPYVQKFKKHPVSGEPLQLKDIVQLHFHKNADNEYHDPILHKVRPKAAHLVTLAEALVCLLHQICLTSNGLPMSAVSCLCEYTVHGL